MRAKLSQENKDLSVIVYDVRSAYNVGAILRTADGAGASKVYLTGYTPCPYRTEEEPYSAKSQKMIAKTALGAEKSVDWEKVSDIGKLIKKLKKQKIFIAALEQCPKSVDFRKVKFKFPCALIVGNEVSGIEEKILSQCDLIASIPMRGKKESLNVSVATGIAIYEILK